MSDNNDTETGQVDPNELTRSLAEVAGRSQQLVKDFVARQQVGDQISMDDALHMSKLFRDLHTRLMADPVQLMQWQMGFWQDYMALVQNQSLRMMGVDSEPVRSPAKGDKRFQHDAWDDNPFFDFVKQTYLLTADYLNHSVNNVEGLDENTQKKIDFHTRQFISAASPSNFLATNPEVLERTVDTQGQNLVDGLNNLLEDLERGNGKLKIRQTDPDAFEVGRDLAITPGKVVYENELMQLIQYSPATEEVARRPLLFVPPWINKYYILDLRPKNSLVKWLLEQGYTVFVISWRNPDASLANKQFEDYMKLGPLAALDAVEQAIGERDVNIVGYCLGGTLLAATLAWMKSRGEEGVHSATFLTTLLDFESPGELGVFIDEEQVSSLEKQMDEQGYLGGNQMASTMSSLRSNDLVWSFFVNNYLMGKDPFPFDLLYWNQDSTNMPARMHAFYLRQMYLENNLREPGGITLDGTPIDLGKVDVPSYFVSAKEDHIAPWLACYAGSRLLGGQTRFVLGGSGHIAGVINPPEKQKYGYWLNGRNPKDPEAWFNGAKHHEGSWWLDWITWLAPKRGGEVPARTPGDGNLKPIEDAPGRYVKETGDGG
ncbi:PHA/PHB synthase family protein [Spiribacter vilamensis]|uniref:Polyhydroxyalkanoate synthase n=1 Tax=Spiribacter vilamensis TaxID=531306 RepID=A0A4Q8D200_9GAMM|nr:class I poly(R)-hydroxyalkanoic acid synthase [Spiribacter vilamensis]RZU99310.1 polyhydroxyalkanoate synthase [Spiribacter vilamensis]TVO61706.1 class I poly(R)-hydroxyalkanoic acid synthase [Spiribacter vilamensis]